MPAAAAPGRAREGVAHDATRESRRGGPRSPVRLRVGLGVPRVHERARRCPRRGSTGSAPSARSWCRARSSAACSAGLTRSGCGAAGPAGAGSRSRRFSSPSPRCSCPEPWWRCSPRGSAGERSRVALLAIGGGFAISGRGAAVGAHRLRHPERRAARRRLGDGAVPRPRHAPGNEARGWWTLLLAASLLAILVLASSIPFRPVVGENDATDERRSARPQGDRALRRED